MTYRRKLPWGLTLLLVTLVSTAWAHGVDGSTKSFLLGNEGAAFVPFLYMGAKHMVTGYDHLLFLVGVIFFFIVRRKYYFTLAFLR